MGLLSSLMGGLTSLTAGAVETGAKLSVEATATTMEGIGKAAEIGAQDGRTPLFTNLGKSFQGIGATLSDWQDGLGLNRESFSALNREYFAAVGGYVGAHMDMFFRNVKEEFHAATRIGGAGEAQPSLFGAMPNTATQGINAEAVALNDRRERTAAFLGMRNTDQLDLLGNPFGVKPEDILGNAPIQYFSGASIQQVQAIGGGINA